jgi:hypothetical protein
MGTAKQKRTKRRGSLLGWILVLMSSSLTLRPTMSKSASRWPATASLRSSFCFRRTVSAARTATFSVCFGLPLFPAGGGASLGRPSLMAATTFLPCCSRRRWWNGARQSSFAARRLPGGGLATVARRRPVVSSLHGAAMSRYRSATALAGLRIFGFGVAQVGLRPELVRWLHCCSRCDGAAASRLKSPASCGVCTFVFFLYASRQSGRSPIGEIARKLKPEWSSQGAHS